MTSMSDILLKWVNYRERLCQLDLVARSTVENQAAICTRLMDGLGNLHLDELRKSHVELHIGERLRSCAPVTVRGELNVLRQVLNWCVDEQLLVTKPRLPTVSVSTDEQALPSDAAFLWVLANVPENHARALEFMMLTGLSPHELERVRVCDVPTGNQLRIGMRPDFPVKQASRRRAIPLNDRARQIWFIAAAGMILDQHPFPTVGTMQKAIRRAVDAPATFADLHLMPCLPIGLAGITPKLMRKWFASKVAGDHPEHVLQRLMGHAPGSPITRRHYVRSSDAQQLHAVDGLSI